MTISNHAFQRYWQRTASDPFESYQLLTQELKEAKRINYNEAVSIGFRLRKMRSNTKYILIPNRRTCEPILGIIVDDVLVTILGHPLKIGGIQ